MIDKLVVGPSVNKPGGKCYYVREKNIGILHIPKCGTKSLKVNMKGLSTFRDLDTSICIQYAAIIRHPVGRWISGFATYAANRINHNKITFKEFMEILNTESAIDHIFKTIMFDAHTKSQYLYCRPVMHGLKLFSADNRSKFYQWLWSNGINAQDEHLHNHEKFADHSPHKIIYNKLSEIVNRDPNKIKILTERYKEDIKLYEQASTD